MKYSKLFYLKYFKGISTQELMRQYPKEVRRISEIALFDLDAGTLKKVLLQEAEVSHILQLRRKLFDIPA